MRILSIGDIGALTSMSDNARRENFFIVNTEELDWDAKPSADTYKSANEDFVGYIFGIM